jgi:ABC-2 type transport system permease protein
MFERVLSILVKEFRQVIRNPRMKMVIFIAPLIQVLVFGYAATTDVKNIPTAIYDLDNTPQSRDAVRGFLGSKYFTARYYITNDRQQEEFLDKSAVKVVLRLNKGFAQDLAANKAAQLQFVVDGTDSSTAAVILSYASGIIERYSQKFMNDGKRILLKKIDVFPAVDLRARAWFNENLESRNFYIPGVIALIVTLMTLLLTAMAVVKEKEIGTIEQLIVSPLRPFEIIVGKLIPFGIIALMDVVFITTLGVLWFRIPIRGSLLLLFSSTIIYLLVSLGTGLFISTLSSTQQEAMMSTFLFYFPAVLLSGFIFPIVNMPRIVQYVTYLNPLRYYIVILRGIFLKGTGIWILWPQMLVLLIMGLAIVTISSLKFRRMLG